MCIRDRCLAANLGCVPHRFRSDAGHRRCCSTAGSEEGQVDPQAGEDHRVDAGAEGGRAVGVGEEVFAVERYVHLKA